MHMRSDFSTLCRGNIIPKEVNRESATKFLEAAEQFERILNLSLIHISRMKGLYMLWNMVDGREKTELYQVYEAVMKELGLPVLKDVYKRQVPARHTRPLYRTVRI